MGGWFAYCISTLTGINTLLLNPAVHSRSLEPFVRIGDKIAEHIVVLGRNDEVIRPEITEQWLNENCRGEYKIYIEDIGHRTPLSIMCKYIQPSVEEKKYSNMIRRYNHFLAESRDSEYLLYYAFDWDDNILHMPTKILMKRKIGDEWVDEPVSTATFAEVRNDTENWMCQKDVAFQEFRDNGPRGELAFLEDVKDAISSQKFAPAWEDFIECLTNGSLFAIITARGHESPTMRKAVEWIIDNYLSDDDLYQMYNQLRKYEYFFSDTVDSSPILRGLPSENPVVKKYLDNCDFVGVSSPSRGGTPENPEKAKEDALLLFADKVNNFSERVGMMAKIGFSDDDMRNVKHIEDLLDNLNNESFANIMTWVVKGTKSRENITKKIRSREMMSETSQQAPGTESSVLKFTQFGNMTGHLYPQGPDQRQNDGANAFRRATNYLTKKSEDILGKKKRKKISKKSSK